MILELLLLASLLARPSTRLPPSPIAVSPGLIESVLFYIRSTMLVVPTSALVHQCTSRYTMISCDRAGRPGWAGDVSLLSIRQQPVEGAYTLWSRVLGTRCCTGVRA